MTENLPDTNVGNNYIRIQDLIDALSRLMTGQTMSGYTWMYTTDVYDAIASLPSADVAPVRHGRWKKLGAWGRVYRCNQCGNFLDFDGVNAGRGDANFCPNCGAKMDAQGEE